MKPQTFFETNNTFILGPKWTSGQWTCTSMDIIYRIRYRIMGWLYFTRKRFICPSGGLLHPHQNFAVSVFWPAISHIDHTWTEESGKLTEVSSGDRFLAQELLLSVAEEKKKKNSRRNWPIYIDEREFMTVDIGQRHISIDVLPLISCVTITRSGGVVGPRIN